MSECKECHADGVHKMSCSHSDSKGARLYYSFPTNEAATKTVEMLDATPRGMSDVGHILAEEIDTMKAVFTKFAWLGDSESMIGTFECDGVCYTVECYPTPDEQKEKLGI